MAEITMATMLANLDPKFQEKLAELIPAHMHDGVAGHVFYGHPFGDFLTAVFTNDLRGSFDRADDANKRAIENYVRFFYSYCPSLCWGNVQKVEAWKLRGGLAGTLRQMSKPIALNYRSVDGHRADNAFDAIDEARTWAHEWIGPHPEIGTSYAVSDDGIGKINIVRGCSLAELFPERA